MGVVLKMRLFLLFLVCFTKTSLGDYIGSIVEYNAVPGPRPNLTVEENLKNYIYQIEQAKGFNAQIIVFPEYGLTQVVSDPTEYALEVPAVGTSDFQNASYTLLSLSNAAREHTMYVVVNLLEKVIDVYNKTIYHNTNLVFSNNGTLVARYRKINLHQEGNLTAGTEVVTFTTDFGTFGLMIGSDILYHNPSQSLLMANVTDVVYSSAWVTQVPFFSSLQYQLGYVLSNKVNLLASNLNDPYNGLGGSSIISADGTVLHRILTDTPATNFGSAVIRPPSLGLRGFDFWRNSTVQYLQNFKNLTLFEFDKYVFKTLNLTADNVTEEICFGDFCCSFNIVANATNTSESYQLVAYNGPAPYNSLETIKFCHIISCINDDIASCGVRPTTPFNTTFTTLTVWGNWEEKVNEFFRPLSLDGNLEPIYNVTYQENRTNQTVGVSYGLSQTAANLVTFGVHVRGGGNAVGVSAFMVVFLLVVRLLF